MKNDEPLRIDGKTIEEWDQLWMPVTGGLKSLPSGMRPVVGLYRCSLVGRISAIGTGRDRRKGMEKRLYDFIRPGDSGRKYYSGRQIHKYRDQLEVEVLQTGPNIEHARETAKLLRAPMIQLHKPAWNVRRASSKTARKGKPKGAGLATKPTLYTGTIPKG